MAYIAQLTASWERRSWREFTRVATQTHTRGLEHPGTPARALFSPYLQQARFERIEPRCRGAAVEMTVWTGYKPTFTMPQRVTLHLVREGGRLKVAAVKPCTEPLTSTCSAGSSTAPVRRSPWIRRTP
jgi:hypothetical protein